MYDSISEQVEAIKRAQLSYRTLHQKAILHNEQDDSNIIIPFNDILRKYHFLLKPIIISYDYSQADQMRNVIRYNPKGFSELLYKTPELWQELLVINDCASVTDFDKKIYRAYDVDGFKEALSEIIILERIIR